MKPRRMFLTHRLQPWQGLQKGPEHFLAGAALGTLALVCARGPHNVISITPFLFTWRIPTGTKNDIVAPTYWCGVWLPMPLSKTVKDQGLECDHTLRQVDSTVDGVLQVPADITGALSQVKPRRISTQPHCCGAIDAIGSH